VGEVLIINKFDSFWDNMKYTKVFRFPMWFINKLKYQSFDVEKEYVVAMRLGHKILLRPTQNYLSNVLFSRQYHDEDIYFVNRFVPDNGVVLDIGANLGLYTCGFAQVLKKRGIQVHAIEAVARNYDFLVRNVELNDFKNVSTYHLALGESEGELEFSLPTKDFVGNAVGGNVHSGNENENLHKETVSMTTLDIWAQQNNVTRCDFIKIDIEGAEIFAFRGGAQFLKDTRPIVQCEYNRPWLDKNNLTLHDYLSVFEDNNYVTLIEDRNSFKEIDKDNFNYHLVDLLFVPKEKLSTL
jgi:FkbM family methyltransferase